jgi:hypothetical protein
MECLSLASIAAFSRSSNDAVVLIDAMFIACILLRRRILNLNVSSVRIMPTKEVIS